MGTPNEHGLTVNDLNDFEHLPPARRNAAIDRLILMKLPVSNDSGANPAQILGKHGRNRDQDGQIPPKRHKTEDMAIEETLSYLPDSQRPTSTYTRDISNCLRDEQMFEPYGRPVPHGKLPKRFRSALDEADLDPEIRRYYSRILPRQDQRFLSVDIDELDSIMRKDAQTRLECKKSDDPQPGEWRLQRKLGSGGWGTVSLWHRVRPGTDQADIIAVKDGIFSGFWFDYSAEFYLMRRLNAVGCPSVPKVYDYINRRIGTKDGEQLGHRMAMEYCDRGSLSETHRFYMKHKLVIPEPFIWHVLNSMAEALVYCNNGQLSESRREHWNPILHRDVKQWNIIMSSPENADASYPDVKLTDFGLAYTLPTYEIQKWKKTHWNYSTKGFEDPDFRRPQRPMTIHSDIYALGITAADFLFTHNNLLSDAELHIIHARPDLLPRPQDDYKNYSPGLRRLVTECCDSEPLRRPTAWQLYQRTQEMVQQNAPKLRAKRWDAFEHGIEAFDGYTVTRPEDYRRYSEDRVLMNELFQHDWWNKCEFLVTELEAAEEKLREEEGWKDIVDDEIAAGTYCVQPSMKNVPGDDERNREVSTLRVPPGWATEDEEDGGVTAGPLVPSNTSGGKRNDAPLAEELGAISAGEWRTLTSI